MKKLLHFIAMGLLFASCIENSVPYSIVELTVMDVTGDGFSVGETDYSSRVVYLDLEEQTDIECVTIKSIETSDDSQIIGDVVGEHNMREPISFTLSKYQEYDWSIQARQDIELLFSVEGQIGSTEFDIDGDYKRATAYISKSGDLSSVVIKELKLGAADVTTYTPTMDNIDTNFTESYRRVYISEHGRESEWRLYVEHTDIDIALSRCDVWARIAWLEAIGDTSSGEAGVDYGFKYRQVGSNSWIEVPSSLVEIESGGFSARLDGLIPSTAYQFVAYSAGFQSEEAEYTSGVETQLPNSDMEDWMQSGSTWYPFTLFDEAYWGTGNPGSAGFGANLTTQSTDIPSGSSGSSSAQLKSQSVFSQFAAGNIFLGEYIATAGTNGIIGFGRSFTSHPVALKFMVKYNQGVINMVSKVPAGVTIEKDVTPDTGIVYIALGSWPISEIKTSSYGDYYGSEDTPYVVYTGDTSTLFDPSGEWVSAYGEQLFEDSVTDWQEVTIPLDYTDTSIQHSHIIVVATASRYGDYFTGSSNSTMWIDDVELIYE